MRQPHTGYVRLAVRAGHGTAVAWAQDARLPCRVSPELSGWVGLCFLDDGAGSVAPDGREVGQVALDLTRDLGCVAVLAVLYDQAVLRLVAYDGGAEAASVVSRPDGGGLAATRGPAAEIATRCGRPDVGESVAAALADTGIEAVERHRRASDLLGLPAQVVGQTLLGAPGQAVDAVVTRAKQPEVVFAATVTKLDGWVIPVDCWTVAVARDRGSTPTAAGLLPFAAGVSGAQRQPALYLWQEGTAGGYAVFRKGRLLDAHAWGDSWEIVAFDEEIRAALAPPIGDAALLAAAFDCGSAEVALRALTRRRADPGRLHDELCELLGVPPVALAVARGQRDPADVPGAEQPEPVSPVRAVWRAATDGRKTSDSPLRRLGRERPTWYRALNAVLTPVFLLGSAAQVVGWREGGGAWRLAFGGWLLLCALVCAWYVRPGRNLPAGQ